MRVNPSEIDTAYLPGGGGMLDGLGCGMLAPQNALRILRRRTGGNISRATFYRWVSDGRIASIRVGSRILIPWPALEELIRQCFEGN